MKQASTRGTLSKLDIFGTVISLACAVHCILLPFVITLLPLIGLKFLGDHEFEKFMLTGTVTIALFALCWGHHVHRNSKVLWLPAVALALFALGLSLEDEIGHAISVALGGLTIAIGHYINTRLCKTCHDCCEADHKH